MTPRSSQPANSSLGIGLMMAKSLAENVAAKVYIVGRSRDRW